MGIVDRDLTIIRRAFIAHIRRVGHDPLTAACTVCAFFCANIKIDELERMVGR